MENGIFESSIRTSGDLVAVFECDHDGGYFYLFDLTKEKGQQARAVIEVSDRGVSLLGSDISVRWNASEEFAGLCIRGDLWAAFDEHGGRYGGSYGMAEAPSIPLQVTRQFKPESGYSGERDIQAGRH